MTRYTLLRRTLPLVLAVAGLPLLAGFKAAEATATVDVDFATPVGTMSRLSTGITITGYGRGNYITNANPHRDLVRALGAGLMRIGLSFAVPGDPSSAVGCSGDNCATPAEANGAQWVTAIRQAGAEPLVILPLDGRHPASVDVSDAVNLYRYLAAQTGTAVRRFTVGNELDNSGNPRKMSAQEYADRFAAIADALRAADPGVIIGGPASASYNTGWIDTLLATAGNRIDFVDFHEYGEGGDGADDDHTDDVLLGATVDRYRTDIADARARIAARVPGRAGQIGVLVGEYNLDWDGDARLQQPFNTVWGAAVLGTILTSGATAVEFGDKVGALGLTGETTDQGWPVNSPLPIYHGISMFTGGGRFRAFGTTTAKASSDTPSVRVFASASPTNVVLVNTGTAAMSTRVRTVGLFGLSGTGWQSTPAQSVPHSIGALTGTGGALTLSLPARSVTTLVLDEQQGLAGTYFDNADLTGASVRRLDPAVNFAWGTGAPDPAIGADTFSVRWTGGLLVDTAGSYTLTTSSDDGVRLWVDDLLRIDQWTDHSTRDDSATVTLSAGVHRIRMEYYDNGYDATAKLSWTPPGQVRQIVPAAHLRPVA